MTHQQSTHLLLTQKNFIENTKIKKSKKLIDKTF